MNRFLILAPILLGSATAALAAPMTPTAYVMTAGASDLYERTASQIVLESTSDPRVKAFATMMIADHGKSTMMVKSAAARSGVGAAPPRLMPLQAELIAELRAENGPARDAAYIAQQKAAHGQALSVQQAYAMEGTTPALKAAAATIVPVVQHHIEILKTM